MLMFKWYLSTALVCLVGIGSTVSCAEEGAGKEEVNEEDENRSNQQAAKTVLEPEADTVVLSGEHEGFVGSYFSLIDGGPGTKAQRIIFMLEEVSVAPEFLMLVKERLPGNRRLKKEAFTLPLTDNEGRRHEFEYIVDRDNRFYTLNYRIAVPAE